MKTRSAIVFVCFLLLVGALGVLLTGCGVGMAGPETVSVTFKTSSAISKAITPDPVGALDVVVYKLHGVGTGGVADGSSFDLDIAFGEVSGTINLLRGQWDIQAVAWNTTQAIGRSAVVSIDVYTGMPQMDVPLVAYEDAGPGTFAVHASWLPDVLALPTVEVEAVTFAGVSTGMTMVPAGNVAANGSLSLQSGFYSAILRVLDDGVLSVGAVEVLRVAKDMTSTWEAYFNVSKLEAGNITFGPDWVVLLPLTLETNIPEGAVTMSESGGDVTLEVTGADFDYEKSGLYSWYKNGEAIALSITNSQIVHLSDMDTGETAYYSCFVWQSDGTRAGAANWALSYGVGSPDQISGTLGNYFAGTAQMTVKLLNEDGTATSIPAVLSVGSVSTLEFDFTDVPDGRYILNAWVDAGARDGTFGAGDGHRTFYDGHLIFDDAIIIQIPTSGGKDYSFFLQ